MKKYENRICKKCEKKEVDNLGLDCWFISELATHLTPEEEKLLEKYQPICDNCIKELLKISEILKIK